jgi:hypothetical protein
LSESNVASASPKNSLSLNEKEIESNTKTEAIAEPRNVDKEMQVETVKADKESKPTSIEKGSVSGTMISNEPKIIVRKDTTIPIKRSKEIDSGEIPVSSKSVDALDKISFPTVDKLNEIKASRPSVIKSLTMGNSEKESSSTDKKGEFASTSTDSQSKRNEEEPLQLKKVQPGSETVSTSSMDRDTLSESRSKNRPSASIDSLKSSRKKSPRPSIAALEKVLEKNKPDSEAISTSSIDSDTSSASEKRQEMGKKRSSKASKSALENFLSREGVYQAAVSEKKVPFSAGSKAIEEGAVQLRGIGKESAIKKTSEGESASSDEARKPVQDRKTKRSKRVKSDAIDEASNARRRMAAEGDHESFLKKQKQEKESGLSGRPLPVDGSHSIAKTEQLAINSSASLVTKESIAEAKTGEKASFSLGANGYLSAGKMPGKSPETASEVKTTIALDSSELKAIMEGRQRAREGRLEKKTSAHSNSDKKKSHDSGTGIYVYIYIYIYFFFTCTHICIYIYISEYVYMYIYKYIHTYTHIYMNY